MAANIIALGYNPTLTSIPGTTQYGTLVVGTTEQDYSGRPGGIDWWASPDLDEMYSIGFPVPTCDHPTPIDGVTACLGFYGSMVKTEQAYIDTVNNLSFTQSISNFITGIDAHNWLISNGYWSSYNYTDGPTITNYLTCGVVYYESASTSLLINDINTSPTYDFFDGKDIQSSSKVQYTVTKGSFTTVYDSSPEFVKLQLPDYDGNVNLVNLRKKNWIPETYKITTFENGLRKTTLERSEILSYEIFDNDGVIGGAMIGKDRFDGVYTISGKTSTIYKLNETLYNVINETEDVEFNCPTDSLLSTESTSLINFFKTRVNDLESQNATTDTICTSILFEIPYNMYTAFTPTVTYTIPEFISFQIVALNTHFNAGPSNENWNFSVAGIVVWNTPDPHNYLNYVPGYAYSYILDVSTYKNNNYNSIYNYDLFYQINKSIWPVTAGSQYLGFTLLGALFTKGTGLNNRNSAFSFGHNLQTESQLSDPNNTTFSSFKTLSHEVGHTFGAAHTFQCGSSTLQSPNSGLIATSQIPICGCDNSSTPPVGCRDIMSYASIQINTQPLQFHPVRMTEMYYYVNNYNNTYPNSYDYTACSGTETTDPYLLVSIIDTNLTQSTNTFTVKYKTCDNETEYTYGSSFTYQQFPLTILISSLSVVSDCFEFTITENITSTQCVDTVNGISTENVLLLPSPSPTPVVEPQEIRTIYTKFNIL